METKVEEKKSEGFATLSKVRIFTTKDYSKFTLSKYNREPRDIKNLVQKIKENDYTEFQPILVDKELNIVDGQHRYLACMELGLPIHFIVSQDIHIFAAAHMNQASKNWSSMDYARHYAQRKNPEYIRLLDLCHKYNQKISIMMSFGVQSSKSTSHSQNVKAGTFKFRDDIDIDDFFEHIKIFDEYYTFSKKERFVKAVLKLYLNENYDKKVMEAKLRLNSGVVHEQPRVDLMTQELLKLYNYSSRKPLKLS